MKRLLLVLFILPVLNFQAFGQIDLKIKGKPEFDAQETIYDFGEVTEGTKVTHDFIFTNTGEAPLIITNVETPCDCTSPYWPKNPVMPGKSDTIKVEFDSKGKAGVFHKIIKVHTNLPVASKQQLEIKGVVEKQNTP